MPRVRIAVGCHPHNAKYYDDGLEADLRRMLKDPRVAALGEIGLDYHYHFSPRDDQREAFRRQLRLAKEAGLPVALHLREAHDEALAIMREEGFPEAGTLLHCFNLDWATLEPWVEEGCYVAFGGALTFKNADDTREAAARVPVNRLLTEQRSVTLVKRLIISGSPRARGRSAGVAEAVRFAFEDACADDDVRLVSLADVRISPCTGCETCARTTGRNELYCIISDDMLRVREMLNACDQLTVVSPVYFAGAPSQLKAFLDRLQPYFYANWRAKPKRPASLYVVGEGGDPHGFGPLVGEARSALAVAGFALESVHDWVGLVSADGALPSGSDVLEGGRVHPASAYTCTGPEGTFPRAVGQV